jgi:hypothetical protein
LHLVQDMPADRDGRMASQTNSLLPRRFRSSAR